MSKPVLGSLFIESFVTTLDYTHENFKFGVNINAHDGVRIINSDAEIAIRSAEYEQFAKDVNLEEL